MSSSTRFQSPIVVSTTAFTAVLMSVSCFGQERSTSADTLGGFGPIKTTEPRVASSDARPDPSRHPRAGVVARSGSGSTSILAFPESVRRDGSDVPPVSIQFSTKSSEDQAKVYEDLQVMNRVVENAIEKVTGSDAPKSKLGIQLWASSGGRSVRPLYIEGFGALFFAKTGIPLIAPPASEIKSAATNQVDSEWQEARRAVFGENRNGRWYSREAEEETVPAYDADLVSKLKDQMIRTLKSASNLRMLAPGESVAISLFGPTGAQQVTRITGSTSDPTDVSVKNGSTQIAAKTVSYVQFKEPSGSGASSGSIITFKAAKSNIDDFARGVLSEEEFKSRVTVTAYAGSGHDVPSLNSWIGSGR